MKKLVLGAILAFGLAGAAPALACDCQKKQQEQTACNCGAQSCPGSCPGMQHGEQPQKKKPEKPKKAG
jgi:hypothetical protein